MVTQLVVWKTVSYYFDELRRTRSMVRLRLRPPPLSYSVCELQLHRFLPLTCVICLLSWLPRSRVIRFGCRTYGGRKSVCVCVMVSWGTRHEKDLRQT